MVVDLDQLAARRRMLQTTSDLGGPCTAYPAGDQLAAIELLNEHWDRLTSGVGDFMWVADQITAHTAGCPTCSKYVGNSYICYAIARNIGYLPDTLERLHT